MENPRDSRGKPLWHAPMDIQLFGAMRVSVAGQPLPRTRSRKERHLLALLALAEGGEVARDTLACTLWPFPEEHARDQALGYLRRSLAELRRALGAAEERIEMPTGRTLRLCLDDDCTVDVLRFDKMIRRLRQFGATSRAAAATPMVATDPREAVALCEEIVALYRAPLLAGVDDGWAVAAREERCQAFRTAVLAYATRALAEGDAGGAADLLRRAVTAEPLWEAGVRQLLTTLVAVGEISAAREVYQTLTRVLRRTFHTEPESETEDLVVRLLGVRSRIVPGVPISSPTVPSRALTMPPLVEPLTGLIGRDQDIVAVTAQLRQARLVTLSGAGGVGKSRLALAVGAVALTDPARTFMDGVGFAELGALSDPAHVAPAVAAALGIAVPPGGDRTALAVVAAALRSRTLLLVLDNCEHLREACARIAATILTTAPRVRILTTSRQPLGLIGEVTWRVPSLATPPPAAEPSTAVRVADITAYPAVQLFIGRASAHRPGFTLHPGNAEAVAVICRSLDGIPLALELAAARIAVLSAAELAERLHEQIPSLATEGADGVDAPPRHRTLHALIAWSFDLLGEEERRLLARLSVFRDGWTLVAAAGVVGADYSSIHLGSLERGLRLLADHSLITAEEDHAAGTVRFRTLETIRQYAGERLEADGERAEREKRHARVFAAWVGEAIPFLYGPEQTTWLRCLAAERENLRAALRYARDHGESAVLLTLAAGLWRFWMLRGEFREGREWLEIALTADSSGERVSDRKTTQSVRERAVAAAAAGLFADFTEGRAVGEARLVEGLRHAQETGDPRVLGLAALFAGYARRHTDLPAALALLEEAETYAGATDDAWLIGEARSTRGYLELYHGDPVLSEACFVAALPQARRCGDPDLTAQVLYHLGLTACRRGDMATGCLYLEECLGLRRAQGGIPGICTTQCFLGRIACHEGRDAEAQERLEEALRLTLLLGNRRYVAPTIEGLALLAERRGDNEWAAELLGAAAAQRATVDATLLPLWPEDTLRLEACLRARLGNAAFTFYFSRGQVIEIGQAVLRGAIMPPTSKIFGTDM